MTICLVSAFSSSQRGLSEYGYYMARELEQDPLLRLTMIVDEIDSSLPHLRTDPGKRRTMAEQNFSVAIPSRSTIFRAAAPRWVPWM